MLLYRYCFVLLCISKYKPPRVYIRRGDLTEGFLRYEFKGLIFEEAYTWRGLFSEFYGIGGEERCVTTLSADQGPVPERLTSNINPKVKF